MKINVLYSEGGRIVALSPMPRPTAGESTTIPVPRSRVEPAEGQRTAVIEIDPTAHGHSLRDIPRRFVVVEDGHGIRLKEQTPRDQRVI